MINNGEYLGVNLVNSIELINEVILKHKKLLEKYNAEFQEIDAQFSMLNKAIEDNKRKHDDILERIDVLKEKRQQLYHQVDQIIEKIPNIQEKDINNLREQIANTKSLISIDEEKAAIKLIYTMISGFESILIDLSIKSDIELRLDEAVKSHEELVSIIASQNDENVDQKNTKNALSKAKPRHSWLEKRIEMHEEALKYWENQRELNKEVATV